MGNRWTTWRAAGLAGWTALSLTAGCQDGGAGEVETDAANSGGATGDTGAPTTTQGGETGETGETGEEPQGDPVGGLVPITCDPALSRAGAPRVWRLSRSEYDNTVADLLGDETRPATAFLPDPRDWSGFSNFADALRVGATQAEQIAKAAQALALDTATNRLDKVFPCAPEQLADAACIDQFVTDLGRRALRRPLTDEEKTRYAQLYALGSADELRGGVRYVVEALLQSPHFLYRSERGDGLPDERGEVRLESYELASALSYALLGTLPDDELLAAAGQGLLADDAEVEAQARRLLAKPEARRGQVELYRQMFGYEELLSIEKDPAVYPQYLELRPSMVTELEFFVRHVLFDADARLETLLTAPYSFLDAGLAGVYGATIEGGPWTQTPLDPQARAGVLTMPGLLANFGHIDSGSIALRGRFVRERLLCQMIPDPPPGAFENLPPPVEGQTGREWYDTVTSGETCAGCHTLINGVGWPFEQLGGIGEPFLQDENGAPPPISGELLGTRDIDGTFVGPVELAHLLVGSVQVQECMTIQHFRYVLGRPVDSLDGCSLQAAHEKFAAADFDLTELAVAAVTSRSFLYRRAE